MLEYRLMCMNRPEHVLEAVVEGIETYVRYTDLNVAMEDVQEINEQCGARFIPVMVH